MILDMTITANKIIELNDISIKNMVETVRD